MVRIANALVAVPLLFLGCGDGTTEPTEAVAEATVVAGATEPTFTPARVDLLLNGTVTWTFGPLDHNVVFSGTGAPADIPVTINGEVSRSFSSSGTFNYSCTIHPGMDGVVVVH